MIATRPRSDKTTELNVTLVRNVAKLKQFIESNG